MRVSRLLFGLALAAGATTARQVGAQNVSFTTTGQFFFGGSSQGSSFTFGDVRLTYNGITTTGFVTTPTNTSLGEIMASCIGACTTMSSLPSGLTLQVAITQTLPFAGGPTLLRTLAFGPTFAGFGGGIAATQSTVSATTDTTSVTFLQTPNATPGTTTTAVIYRFTQTEYDIVSPSTNGGVTSLQGFVETDQNFVVTATPEPASVALMAGGLLGLAGVAVRRRRQS